MNFREFSKRVHATAVEKGWWDLKDDDHVGGKIALMHSELSEALEEYRKGKGLVYYEVDGKPEGFAVELADCIIRICDLCERLGLDIATALELKANYNDTRSYRHGGKSA